jgi:hypothetical protein
VGLLYIERETRDSVRETLTRLDFETANSIERKIYVLWTAQVHDIGAGMRRIVGKEIIGGRAGHVDNIGVLSSRGIELAGLSQHDTGVDIDGVRRILHGRDHVAAKHLLQAHDIALGTVYR